MDNENVLSFLGLMMKAKRLGAGSFECESSLYMGKSRLIVFSQDISENTMGKILSMAKRNGVDCIKSSFGKYDIGQVVGKGQCAVISINDKGFAKALTEKLSGSYTVINYGGGTDEYYD